MNRKSSASNWIIRKFGQWFLKNDPPNRFYLSNFKLVCAEIKIGDVLLIEGRNRVSAIIKEITQSPWSHAVLYIGKIEDIEDPAIRRQVKKFYHNPGITSKLSGHLLIETDIGIGTTISPIEKYREDHIRILRAQAILSKDIQKVISYAVSHLGTHYSFRHIFDLARFLFPWSLFPRRWRSTLFQHNALKPTEDICSTLIAESFHSVNFPILPLMVKTHNKTFEVVQLNPRLFTPSDFDYSPYFSIIKYPIFPSKDIKSYRDLPWRLSKVNNEKFNMLRE